MSFLDKLSDQFDKLSTRADRLKETVAFAVNPDHRHDEAHEKAEDEERLAIAKSHRFESFADVREGNDVKWYIGGHDYFYALSEILENAKETIWIMDWWLTPELFLRRPPALHEDFRLDRLLLRKAEQGVKVFVMVYKEVTQAATLSSAHTKHFMEDLHENVAVMRHPDHLGGEVTLYFSHHDKVVIVDNVVACIGGLDICFGRWDIGSHPLSDVHPTDFSRTLFAGQDFNNARVQDFHDVDHWASNQQNRLEVPRMPWQDIHTMFTGPAVLDYAQHFVENFIRNLKYSHDRRYPLLAFPHPEPAPFEFRHPHLQRFRDMGHHFNVHKREPGEEGAWDRPIGGMGQKGSMRVQVLRSSADWSHGISPREHSIQNAYCQMIRESRHYCYIENQFFITSTGAGKGPVENMIGAAIVDRVLSAARSGEKFKVVIVIPAIPGFAGDLLGNSGTLAIMGAQFMSLSRGGHSIFEEIQQAGFNPLDFIEVYHLRSYDRINYDPDRLTRQAERSGVSWEQAQAALARVYLGPDALESELKKNAVVKIVDSRAGAERETLDTREAGKEENKNPVIEVPLPQSYDEAWATVHRFEQGAERREEIADSVAHHSQASGRSLLDEPWSGSEDAERNAYVTEQCYIHSKLLIVDDDRVLIGSANINDRSQNGDRDSEVAIVIEDDNKIDSFLAGRPAKVSRFAATLRRQLYKEHLGLAPPQMCPPHEREEPVTPQMKPVGVALPDQTMSREDQLVMDPCLPETETLLRGTAATNADIFDDVFHCVPSPKVETWEQYKNHVPQAPIKPGHVASPTRPVREIKEQLARVRGHIVAAPLNFLREGKAGPLLAMTALHRKPQLKLLLPHHHKERLLALDASVNPVTLSIYL
ncbi:hypothetical protein JCM6882_008832 [Rhodosporidiobolus microsporus]